MRIVSLCVVLLGFGIIAAAPPPPSAADLVARNLAARGGAAQLASLKGVRFEGRMVFPGDFQLTYRETRARTGVGGALRIDAALQGLTLVQAYDGSSAWRINPFEGRKDAERMSLDEARALADQALLEGPLLSSRRDGSTVTYLGREDFDGTLAYKLRVAKKDGDDFVYLLDPDTFLEIKEIETRRVRGTQQVTEYELGDYEKVGGVYFPMSIDSWPQGQPNQRQQVIIATASADPAVTPTLFAQPAGPGGRDTATGKEDLPPGGKSPATDAANPSATASKPKGR